MNNVSTMIKSILNMEMSIPKDHLDLSAILVLSKDQHKKLMMALYEQKLNEQFNSSNGDIIEVNDPAQNVLAYQYDYTNSGQVAWCAIPIYQAPESH